MSTRFRAFFIDRSDHLHKVPLKRLERLINKDNSERFPEFAGERVRYALIAIEVENRRPVAINRADYSILKLNSKGKLDTAEWTKKLRLVMGMMSLPISKPKNTSVIEAGEHFAKKRYEHEFRRQPSPEIEEAIEEAIFGSRAG